jgi:hypothetical protein
LEQHSQQSAYLGRLASLVVSAVLQLYYGATRRNPFFTQYLQFLMKLTFDVVTI